MHREEKRVALLFLQRARYALFLLYRKGSLCEKEYLKRIKRCDRLIDRLEAGFCTDHFEAKEI